MERELKKFDAEFKAAAQSDGSYEMILSVPTEDRDGEIIDAKAFEPVPDWLNIDIDHGMSVVTTVGSGTPFYEGDTLKLRDFRFASTTLGQEVKTLVDERHVRKMSVAYMNSEYEVDENDGKSHLRSAELLNAAIVSIPSNRQADILAAKSADLHDRSAQEKTVLADVALEVAGDGSGPALADDAAAERVAVAVAAGTHEPTTITIDSTDPDPEEPAAANAAAVLPADVSVELALAELVLADADLAT